MKKTHLTVCCARPALPRSVGLAQTLEVRPATALEAPALHPAAAAAVVLAGKLLGTFGQVHPLLAQSFDVPAATLVGELDFEPVVEVRIAIEEAAAGAGAPVFSEGGAGCLEHARRCGHLQVAERC